MAYSLKINDKMHNVDVDGDTPLLWVLRDVLGMTGTKFGCGMGLCGACTIHVDGHATRACLTPVQAVAKSHVQTIEALAQTDVGAALQKAWLALDVPQCGYCQSGQLMSAAGLLATNRAPTDEQIDVAMAGNICRCGTYPRIRAGIHEAAKALAQNGGGHGA
jgi:isoquinoline 1-oxidoreductase alpha subunit